MMRKRMTVQGADQREKRGVLGVRSQGENTKKVTFHKSTSTTPQGQQAPSKTDGPGSGSGSGSGSPTQAVQTVYVNANSSQALTNGTTIVQGPVTIVVMVNNNPSSTSSPPATSTLDTAPVNQISTTQLPTAAPLTPNLPTSIPDPTSSNPSTSASSTSPPLIAPNSLSSSSKQLSHAAIAGIVIGSLVGLALLVVLGLWVWRKWVSSRRTNVYEDMMAPSHPNPYDQIDPTAASTYAAYTPGQGSPSSLRGSVGSGSPPTRHVTRRSSAMRLASHTFGGVQEGERMNGYEGGPMMGQYR